MQRSRPANRPGQTRGGRRGQLEAFERRAEAANATAARAAEADKYLLDDTDGVLTVNVRHLVDSPIFLSPRRRMPSSANIFSAPSPAPART